MALVDWSIKGLCFANCNCAWGCPCQFNALPTHGDCRALLAGRIDEGHFGEVRLDGLTWVATAAWPGAVHEGNGTWQSIIDENASEQQRTALARIMHGEETVEGSTMFHVYSTTVTERLDPLFKPIEFECDVEERRARVVVPGVLESTGEPIRNPVTGDEQRVRVVMPNGFEYHEAEYGSGSTRATGAVELRFSSSYGQFHHLHLSQNGVVR